MHPEGGEGSEPCLDPLGDWRRTHYSREVGPELDGQTVTVFGWVHTIRDLGGIKFIILEDREGKVQVTLKRGSVDEGVLRKAEALGKQYVVGVRGVVRKCPQAPGGAEIIPSEIRILNYAKHPLPLDPTGRVPADLDTRLDARILDLRRPEGRAVFKVAHEAVQAMREYLVEQGFVEVFTPKIIATATEGGAALFPVYYFDREAFLAQSPQLYKEQLTSVFERVFEIGTYFRAEESNTTRHLSEFVSVDVEAAFADAEDVMKVLEGMVAAAIARVKDRCARELEVLKVELEVPKLPLRRMTYEEALRELASKGIYVEWGEDIPTPALRELGKLHEREFYFITDWPTASKPFYIKPRDDRPELCEAFDLMYEWIELASGGTRIHEKGLLIKRLEEQGLSPSSFKHHLSAFELGMPPHAGWGLGLARLLMVLTGRENIRECVLFPRDRFRLTP